MDYILWGVSWQMLVLMLADAPRYVKHKATPKPKQDTLTLFQSLLKNHADETH